MKRHVWFLGVVAATLGVAVAVAGCGDSRSTAGSRSISNAGGRSILLSGITSVGATGRVTPTVVTDAGAIRAGRHVRALWLSEIREGKLGQTGNVSPREFRSRLTRAASRYGFTVERVRFLKIRGQIAPVVIVETRRYLAFARATPAITDLLDPLSHKRFLSLAGLFLRADDERGVPFLITFGFANSGGQWARSDQLFPFAHG